MATADVEQRKRTAEAVRLPFTNFLNSCKGRTGRAELWKSLAAMLFCAVTIYLPLGVILMLAREYFIDLYDVKSDLYHLSMFSYLYSKVTLHLLSNLTNAISVPILIVCFPTLIRRCHDRGRSGWFLAPAALLGLVPYVAYLVWTALLIDLGALKGMPGTNFYGPPPGQP